MTITDFSIFFEREIYQPGQVVNGFVLIRLDGPKEVRGIEVKLKGRTKFHWQEQESYTDSDGKTQHRNVTREGKETYLKTEMKLLKGRSEVELTIGEHRYPFSVILPANLPSSFHGKYGGISYYGKGKVDIAWAPDKTTKRVFTVQNLLNLNNQPHLQNSQKEEDSKTFCCMCCASGPLTVVLYLPKTGFAKYESIPVTVEIDNASNVDVTSVKAFLKRKTHWTAVGDTKEEKDKIISLGFGDVPQNNSKTFSELMDLKSGSYPDISHCNIIHVTYKIEVEASPDGMHTDLEVGIPVTIGDIGFDGENPASANMGSAFPPPTQAGYPDGAVPVPQLGYPGGAVSVPQPGYPGTVVPASQPGFQGVPPVSQPGYPAGLSAGPAPFPNPYPNTNTYPGANPYPSANPLPNANPYPNPNATPGMGFNQAAGSAPYPQGGLVTPYPGQPSTYAANNGPPSTTTFNAAGPDDSTDKTNLFNASSISMPSSNFLTTGSQSEDRSNQFTPLLPLTPSAPPQ